MLSLFLSYSHRDEVCRNELETHLVMLKRQRVIDVWHDRRIGAGEEVDARISEHLEAADIILLLVSADFLASDYCYGIEMTRALERHERGEARVIPVILRPCDWHQAPFAHLRATPPDGKPVSKFPDKDDAYLAIVEDVRAAATDSRPQPAATRGGRQQERVTRTSGSGEAVRRESRSSNLRVKKHFSDRERDVFLEESFEYMANYFEQSLQELKRRNPEVDGRFRRIDADHFSGAVYRDGALVSSCRIWRGSWTGFVGGIAYAAGETGGDNSYNESLSIVDDGYGLFLKPLGMAFHGHPEDEFLTRAGGAEYLWAMFVEPLQR